MAGPAEVGVAGATGAGAAHAWPAPRVRYWALAVIVLATFITFFDSVIFGMLAERIKHDFGLTDAQLGFLAGPAGIIAYFFVGIPLARLADVYPRKFVLAGGAMAMGVVIAAGGMAQSLGQFIASRVFLAASGSAHAPSSYSLLADAFPPQRLTRAFALLQFGFIGGTTLGPLVGGMLVMRSRHWDADLGPLHFHGWQWILIGCGLAAVLVGLLFLTIGEPPRAMAPSPVKPVGGVLTVLGWDAFRAIAARPRVFLPLFGALALSATDSFGLAFWRVPFMIRTFGWNEGQIGPALGLTLLVGSLSGLVIGAVLVEWLAKRHKDANVRAAAICFACVTIASIASPLMPNPWLSLAASGIGVAFGLAGAVPQNAAVQRVAPPAMRGQVTAIYLFMFTFFGAMGSFLVGLIQDRIVGDPHRLWLAMVICAATLLPVATLLMISAMRPYAAELDRIEAMETPQS